LSSKTHLGQSRPVELPAYPPARSNAKFFASPKQLLRACELVKPCKLEDVSHRLGEAVLDPLMLPVLMEDSCTAVGAKGAALLQSDVRTEDIPRTAGSLNFLRNYFDSKLHVADVRVARGVPLLLTKTNVVTDADLFTSEAEMLRYPLYGAAAGRSAPRRRGFLFVSGCSRPRARKHHYPNRQPTSLTRLS
jgi:hypothetical protein